MRDGTALLPTGSAMRPNESSAGVGSPPFSSGCTGLPVEERLLVPPKVPAVLAVWWGQGAPPHVRHHRPPGDPEQLRSGRRVQPPAAPIPHHAQPCNFVGGCARRADLGLRATGRARHRRRLHCARRLAYLDVAGLDDGPRMRVAFTGQRAGRRRLPQIAYPRLLDVVISSKHSLRELIPLDTDRPGTARHSTHRPTHGP